MNIEELIISIVSWLLIVGGICKVIDLITWALRKREQMKFEADNKKELERRFLIIDIADEVERRLKYKNKRKGHKNNEHR
jgi:hypothetical protein|nr:MAG TPA: hypothetical protein [Caudoviricetes sp.]